MDNFEKIIRDSLDHYEVPYNESHWIEMDARLRAIRTGKIKKKIFGCAVTIAMVAVASYFMFSNNEGVIKDGNNILADEHTAEVITKNDNIQPLKEQNNLLKNNIAKENVVGKEINLDKNKLVNNEENTVENKIDVKLDENSTEPPTIKSLPNAKMNVPNAEFIVYNNRACLGEIVKFEAHENDFPVAYTWNFGDGTISHKTNPTHTYKESLVYTVSLTLLNRQTGVEYTTIQQDIVHILPLPEISFTYLEESKKYDDNAFKYPYTIFNVKNIDKNTAYQWTFGNGEHSTSTKAKTIYETKGSFVVKLLATNSYGCENSTKKRVTIKNGAALYTPNAFTPNGDSDNDNFIPISLLEWDIQFEMTIVDKAGKLIYETSNKDEPWNGKINNSGQMLPDGIYLWQVVTYDSEGTPHRHQGQINLIK